jgi:hypothetical protein
MIPTVLLQQSIKLIQGNPKIDPSIFAWGALTLKLFKLLEFSLKRYAQR